MKAFPQAVKSIYGEENSEYGMDLRDYFAAKAMQGICANPMDGHQPDGSTYEEYVAEIAEDSYQIADAMMKARSK